MTAVRRLALGVLAATAVGVVAALPVAAKQGVTATLKSAIPPDAQSGTQLRVRWSLSARDDEGTRRPYSAGAVFVRLLSRAGADATVGFASSDAHADGRYAASVVVPEGGIRDIQIGLRGFTSGANGTHNADVLFPIANDPLPGVAPVAPREAGTDRTPWLVGVVGGVILVLTLVAVFVLRRRSPGMVARG